MKGHTETVARALKAFVLALEQLTLAYQPFLLYPPPMKVSLERDVRLASGPPYYMLMDTVALVTPWWCCVCATSAVVSLVNW